MASATPALSAAAAAAIDHLRIVPISLPFCCLALSGERLTLPDSGRNDNHLRPICIERSFRPPAFRMVNGSLIPHADNAFQSQFEARATDMSDAEDRDPTAEAARVDQSAAGDFDPGDTAPRDLARRSDMEARNALAIVLPPPSWDERRDEPPRRFRAASLSRRVAAAALAFAVVGLAVAAYAMSLEYAL